MSRYDGLIIPRSYSEYINKTDAATLLQALQLSGVMDNAPTANSNHPTKSGGVYTALAGKQATLTFDDAPTRSSNNPVKSNGIYNAIVNQNPFIESNSVAFANNSANEKIILLGVMETNADGRAGLNLDISYRRVDTMGRIFATLRADELTCKYLCISPSYVPVTIKKTKITTNRKYNVYILISGYTPMTRIVINAPLNFTVQGVEKSALEGTEVTCTPVNINNL